MAANKIVNCAQVSDINTGIKQYQDKGCSLKYQTRAGCAMMECGEISTFICETHNPDVTPSAHDEMDEPYIDYWKETPD